MLKALVFMSCLMLRKSRTSALRKLNGMPARNQLQCRFDASFPSVSRHLISTCTGFDFSAAPRPK